jgi:hypothetical protein
MNRPPVRFAAAVLALVLGAAVVAVTAAGLIGLALALVATQPLSSGRVTAAGIFTAGLVLLVLVQVLDRHALPGAVERARAVTVQLVGTVASAGRR